MINLNISCALKVLEYINLNKWDFFFKKKYVKYLALKK